MSTPSSLANLKPQNGGLVDTATGIQYGGVIGQTNTQVVSDPTGGAAPWSVATITTETLSNALNAAQTNVESVTFYLRGPSAFTNGTITADYTVNANGSLTPDDQIFRNADGSITQAYFGNEAANPFLNSVPDFTPPNPGYIFTEYSISAAGGLTQVVAENSNGTFYTGV